MKGTFKINPPLEIRAEPIGFFGLSQILSHPKHSIALKLRNKSSYTDDDILASLEGGPDSSS